MDDRAYWIWAQQAFGEGSPKPWDIFRRYPGGLEAFFQGGPRLWNSLNSVTEKEAAGLFSFSLGEAEARLEYAEKVGWTVLVPTSEKYPEALRNISDPPAVLYGKGALPDLESSPVIAVVGARKAEEEALRAAEKIGYQLAAGGAVVVSGGALGADCAGLMGALSASGPTISVLPVDLGSPYLSSNAALRRMIPERDGALLSEYFSQRSPGRGTFPVRNRLITGLCCGVVLIQAGTKSGTIIYARHAAAQNRDVFVYPGPAASPLYAGSRSLLEDGAKPVTCGEDILEEYVLRFRKKRRKDPFEGLFGEVPLCAAAKAASLADGETGALSDRDKVLGALGREPVSVAQLEERTGLSAAALLGLLTELELDGLAASAPGKRYRRR